MPTQLAPQTVKVTSTSEYDYRVLYLSGTWSRPGSEFRLRATLLIQKDGSLDGAIYWRAVKSNGRPADFFATEHVQGSLRQNELEFDGVDAEPGLITDSYRLKLSGSGEAGPFGGITKTCMLNWCGCMEGQYVFRNRKN